MAFKVCLFFLISDLVLFLRDQCFDMIEVFQNADSWMSEDPVAITLSAVFRF